MLYARSSASAMIAGDMETRKRTEKLKVQKHTTEKNNNGPYQDRIFDNPSALCLALWAKHRIRMGGWGGGGGGTDAPYRLFMKGVRLSVSTIKNNIKKNPPSDLLCLRSFRSKYNASTINYLLVFSALRLKN